MINSNIVSIFLLLILAGCSKTPEPVIESWADKPRSEWPDFALTNKISFADTTFTDIANSFLVDTGKDTVAVSCKHLFMVFENRIGIETIDLGDSFQYWNIYPKNNPEESISLKKLINTNANEIIGQFNTLKARDWIIFEIDENNTSLYPLKIRYTPIKKHEVVYAVGWGSEQKDNSIPAIRKLQCIDNLGDYYYVKTITLNVLPNGRSGSPIIDKNGYLVGIVSGAEGKLGVIGSVNYLKKLFDQYKVEYIEPGS